MLDIIPRTIADKYIISKTYQMLDNHLFEWRYESDKLEITILIYTNK